MVAYARGTHAKAICDKCGLKVSYLTLITEWNNLRVCPECYDPKHPQLNPRSAIDPETLYQPRPDSRTETLKWRASGLAVSIFGSPEGIASTITDNAWGQETWGEDTWGE